MGAACGWWLDKSLALLGERIAAKGGKLILRRGAAEAVITGLVEETGAEAVYWNRRYGAARKIDERIKAALKGDALALYDVVVSEHAAIDALGRSVGTGVALH